MLPAVDENFDLPNAIQWLIDVTKSAGLPGVKPVRHSTNHTVAISQQFKASQTLGIKYKKYKIMLDGLVAKFELTGGWGALPRNYVGQHIFVSADNRICVMLSHVIGNGQHPAETFEIEVRNLKPKATPII
jgi:hypothetical protein